MKRFWGVFAFVCLSLTGCSEFHELTVKQENDVLLFSAEEFSNTPVSIDSLAVWQKDCDTDCVYWQAHRPVDIEADPVLYGEGKIQYGQKFEQIVETVPAKPLVAGTYQFGVEVVYKNEDGQLVGGSFAAEFALTQTNGKLILAVEPEK